MGVPKYRRSRREKRNHRAHWLRPTRVAVSECPRCHEPKLPHRVCPHCGHYRGLEILDVAEEEE